MFRLALLLLVSVPVTGFADDKPDAANPTKSPGVVYLSDLAASSVSTIDRGFERGGIGSVKGTPAAHGIILHPPAKGFSRAAYDLRGRYRRFQAAVAIRDGTNGGRGSASPLTFEVRGDGALLWQSKPVQRCHDVQECDVEVAGKARLELRVVCPGDAFCAHAMWVEPRLVGAERPAGAPQPPTGNDAQVRKPEPPKRAGVGTENKAGGLPATADRPDYVRMKAGWEADRKRAIEKELETSQKWLKQDQAELDRLTAEAKAAARAVRAEPKAKKEQRAKDIESLKRVVENHKRSGNAPDLRAYLIVDDISAVKPGYFGRVGWGDVRKGRLNPTNINDPIGADWKVLQVVDKSHALLSVGELTFYAEMDTTGLIDGGTVRIEKFVHCYGTHSYTSASGAQRTVLAIRLVD